jgi:hypothetical protein
MDGQVVTREASKLHAIASSSDKLESGRTIQTSEDSKPGQGAVAVISYGLWEREFAHSPAALGQVIKLNNSPLTIIGVNPRKFTGAQSILSSPDLFVPLSMQPLVSPASWNGPDALSELANTREWWVNVSLPTLVDE